MSYSFEMLFTECEPEEVLDTCLAVVKTAMTNPIKIIQENECCIPSRRYALDERVAYEINELWLYRLFNFNFVYWKEHKLLGLSGDNFGEAVRRKFAKCILFQNSCDQNYDYSVWSGMTCFDDIISKVVDMDIGQVLEAYWFSDNDNHAYQGLAVEALYYKQSLVYKQIYSMLDLDNWLYGNDGKFQRLTFNGIDSSETLLKILYDKRVRRMLSI